MKERPILFSAPMVRAILEGRKTQTRRLQGLKQFNEEPNTWEWRSDKFVRVTSRGRETAWPGACPYGELGDRLWVKESWAIKDCGSRVKIVDGDFTMRHRLQYPATDIAPSEDLKGKPYWWNRRNAMFMPRWASRILLEITEVRIERLQEISEEDAKAEGCAMREERIAPAVLATHSAAAEFETLWESINGAGSWDANPWVWAITFNRIGVAT